MATPPTAVPAAGRRRWRHVVVARMGSAAWRQTDIWLSSENLWRAAVRAEPDVLDVSQQPGRSLAGGRADPAVHAWLEAEPHFRAAMTLRPGARMPYHNLRGALRVRQKRPPEECRGVVRRVCACVPPICPALAAALLSALGGLLLARSSDLGRPRRLPCLRLRRILPGPMSTDDSDGDLCPADLDRGARAQLRASGMDPEASPRHRPAPRRVPRCSSWWRARLRAGASTHCPRPRASPGAPSPRSCSASIPLRVESVAWVTERRDVLCGLFYCLAVLAYLRRSAGRRAPRGPWSWLSLLAFGAALPVQAIAMTLPLTLLLLDVYPLRRTTDRLARLLARRRPMRRWPSPERPSPWMAVSVGAAWTAYDTYRRGARAIVARFWFYPQKFVLPTTCRAVRAARPHRSMAARVLWAWPAWSWWPRPRGSPPAIPRRARRLAALGDLLAPVSASCTRDINSRHDRYTYLCWSGFAVLAGAGVVWSLRRGTRGASAPLSGSWSAAGDVAVVLGSGGASTAAKPLLAQLRGSLDGGNESIPVRVCRSSLGIAMVRAGPRPSSGSRRPALSAGRSSSLPVGSIR